MRHNGGERRPNEILAEIERTRSEMDTTLTAIEHRLTPGQLVDQGIHYLRHSGANEFVANLGGQVKHNPLPVGLVGIGLAWLMAAGKKEPYYGSGEYSGGYGAGGTSRLSERAHETWDRTSGAAESAKNKLSEGAQSARNKLSEGAQSVREGVSQVGDRMSQLGQSARERASDLGSSARYQVERAKSSLDYMMREQPLALGAIGLAVGAFVAALAPRTRKEDELMGDTRDRLMDQAKQVGKEKLGEVERVATAAMGTASQEAQRQGLMKPPQQQSGEQTPSTGKSTPAQAQPGATPPVTPKPGEKAGAATMHSGAATSSGSGNAP